MDRLKTRVLIADPDPDVSKTLLLYFEEHGHQGQLVDLAGTIISAARQWQPNAILISTELADQNPHMVCRQLLEDTRTSHIPIVMMLHLDDRRARLAALEAGADDIVTSPIDIEELRLRVEASIRLSSMRLRT